jgi:hypothetical protein
MTNFVDFLFHQINLVIFIVLTYISQCHFIKMPFSTICDNFFLLISYFAKLMLSNYCVHFLSVQFNFGICFFLIILFHIHFIFWHSVY